MHVKFSTGGQQSQLTINHCTVRTVGRFQSSFKTNRNPFKLINVFVKAFKIKKYIYEIYRCSFLMYKNIFECSVQRLRCWPNIRPTLGQGVMIAGLPNEIR